MINRLIEVSLRNRFLVLGLFALLGAWGYWALLTTPIDAIPDLSDNQVIVFTDWTGRSPQEVEDQITYPLTVSLQGLPGVRVVRSSSAFGFSMINVIFEDNIDLYFARSRSSRTEASFSAARPRGHDQVVSMIGAFHRRPKEARTSGHAASTDCIGSTRRTARVLKASWPTCPPAIAKRPGYCRLAQ
jgi:Cu/Ag efflux pump CusA